MTSMPLVTKATREPLTTCCHVMLTELRMLRSLLVSQVWAWHVVKTADWRGAHAASGFTPADSVSAESSLSASHSLRQIEGTYRTYGGRLIWQEGL